MKQVFLSIGIILIIIGIGLLGTIPFWGFGCIVGGIMFCYESDV